MGNITYNFSTKKNGDMREDQNLIAFLKSEDVLYTSIIRPKQTHSDHIQIIDTIRNNTIHTIPDCDGVITTQPGLVLTIITGDCVPILFIDKKNGVIGASHQGWKGTYARMAEKMIEHMESIGAKKAFIEVIFGPSICGNCYAIPKDRYQMFSKEFPSFVAIIPETNGSHHTINLQDLNIFQLEQLGVPLGNITRSEICTQEDETMYSFRGDTKQEFGEIVSYVMLQ